MHLEAEAHVLFQCPLYQAQRRDFAAESDLVSHWGAAASSEVMRKAMLTSQRPRDWAALGKYLARIHHQPGN